VCVCVSLPVSLPASVSEWHVWYVVCVWRVGFAGCVWYVGLRCDMSCCVNSCVWRLSTAFGCDNDNVMLLAFVNDCQKVAQTSYQAKDKVIIEC
jgi:hypothetical protein